MDLGFEGKTVLVTGSYRGTGQAIAERFAAEGATVAVHGLEAGTAEPVADAINAAHPGRAFAVTGDITSDAGAAQLVAELNGRPIDILINNYGAADRGSWDRSETADWIRSYEINVLSAMRVTRALLPPMRERRWGRIVFLGTIGSTAPAARMPHYYAAKGALHTMMVSLAKELAHTGITVNLVSPGLIRTPEVEANLRARAAAKGWGEDWSVIEARALEEGTGSLTGHIATPAEVASAVLYLASAQAAAITAVNLRVDGGATAAVT